MKEGINTERIVDVEEQKEVKRVKEEEGKNEKVGENDAAGSIPAKIRKHLKAEVVTRPKKDVEIPEEEVQIVGSLVKQYEGSVCSEDKIGNIKTKPIHFEYESNFEPEELRFRNTPLPQSESEQTSAIPLRFP